MHRERWIRLRTVQRFFRLFAEMKTKSLPSLSYLRQCFVLTRSSQLRWRVRPLEHFRTSSAWKSWNTKFAGKLAGYVNKLGYVQLRIDGSNYLAHRVIWFMRRGEDPGTLLDHRDGVGTNNTARNLRKATSAQNISNTKLAKNNTSGVKGVFFDNRCGRWRAAIRKHRKYYDLGSFSTLAAAKEAVTKKRKELHGAFARNA